MPLTLNTIREEEPKECVFVISDPVNGMATHLFPKKSSNFTTEARAIPHSAALLDDGATVSCTVTKIGRIAGTHNSKQVHFALGDSNSKLASEGSWLYGWTRIGANGCEHDAIMELHYAPTGIGNILSEGLEVNWLNAQLTWTPGTPRRFEYPDGAKLEAYMTPDGLGWFQRM